MKQHPSPQVYLPLALFVAVSVLFFGCTEPDPQTQAPPDPWDIFADNETVVPRKVTGDLRIVGSSTAEPLLLFAAERFRALGYEGTLTIESPGSLGALRGWVDGGDYDLVVVSVAPDEELLAPLIEGGIDPVVIPLAQDALGVAVPRSNTFAQNLDLASLGALFSTARTWNQVESTWPELRITKMSPGPDSGTYSQFIDTVFDGEPVMLRSPFVQFSEDDSILVRGIAQGAGAVGYMGYSYLKDRQNELRLLPIEGVAISPDSIERGDYPLARNISILVDRRTLGTIPAAYGFLSYLFSLNPEDLENLGFFSLSPSDRGLAEGTLREVYRGLP